MDIQTEKLEIIQMLLETDNPEVLESIKEQLKKDSEPNFWETLPPDQEEDVFMDETDDFDDFIKKYGR
jgi:hypothetical protein